MAAVICFCCCGGCCFVCDALLQCLHLPPCPTPRWEWVADDLTDFGMRGAMYTVNDESVTKPPKFFTNKDIQVAVTRIALMLGVCLPYHVAPPLVL
jgi:hypothetical protein